MRVIALPASAVLLGLRLATVLGSENVLPDRYSACQRVKAAPELSYALFMPRQRGLRDAPSPTYLGYPS
jgi:hypothetical protein